MAADTDTKRMSCSGKNSSVKRPTPMKFLPNLLRSLTNAGDGAVEEVDEMDVTFLFGDLGEQLLL